MQKSLGRALQGNDSEQLQMNNLVVLVAGIVAVALATRMEPIRGWWRAMLGERYLLAFVVPLFVLLGWPLETFDPFREGDQLGWQRIGRMLLFGLAAAHFLLKGLARGRTTVPPLTSFSVFSSYAVLCAVSTFWSAEPLQTLWKAIELMVVLMVATELYQDRRSPADRAAGIAASLLLLSFALCLMSLVGAMLAPERAWRDWGLEGLGVRSMGGVVPMVNPNMLGQLGGIVAMVGIFRLLLGSGRRSVGDFLVPAVGMATLFLAYSRTSILACVLIYFLATIRLRRTRWLLFLTLPGAVAVTLFAEQLTTYLARGQSAEQLHSLTGRMQMWESALNVFWERPLLGHGFFVGHKSVEWGSSGKLLATVDSTYIETLVNVGIVGFVLVLSFAVLAGLQSWRGLRACRLAPANFNEVGMIFFVLVVFALIRSLTASSFQVLHYNLIFVLFSLVGLSLLARGLSRERTVNPLDQVY
ncbi:MAG: O-antigen ligase family protein [Candidatus Accumulibacter sp. UW20]